MEETTITVGDFSKNLFWDSNVSTLDFEKHRNSIIERVLTHGTLDDWFLIKKRYGKDAIKTAAMQLRYLDKRALAFCSAYFDEPINRFRCYIFAQSNPTHWDY